MLPPDEGMKISLLFLKTPSITEAATYSGSIIGKLQVKKRIKSYAKLEVCHLITKFVAKQ